MIIVDTEPLLFQLINYYCTLHWSTTTIVFCIIIPSSLFTIDCSRLCRSKGSKLNNQWELSDFDIQPMPFISTMAQSYITVVTTLLHVDDLNWDNNIARKNTVLKCIGLVNFQTVINYCICGWHAAKPLVWLKQIVIL